MIEDIDKTVPYLCRKIKTNNIGQKEKHPQQFYNIMYDIKDKTFNIDDFLEIKISKFELF
jgi:hypothetical protein